MIAVTKASEEKLHRAIAKYIVEVRLHKLIHHGGGIS